MIKSLLIFLISIITLLHAATYTSKTYTYKTVGDLDIEAIVYSPTLDSEELSPVLMAIHGGGYVQGSKTYLGIHKTEIEEALSRDWTVVSIDYRLAPAVLFEDIVQDVQDAYAWIRNKLSQVEPINPDVITIFGQSAGAGLALIAGYRFSPRPKAIIAFYPHCANFNDLATTDMANPPSEELLTMMNSLSNQNIAEGDASDEARDSFFYRVFTERKSGWLMVSRDSEESAESIYTKLQPYSPVGNIDEDYPPTYLNHGLRDELVMFTQAIEMAEKLQEKKIEFELDLISGARHGFDVSDHSKKVFENHVLPAFDFAAKFMRE